MSHEKIEKPKKKPWKKALCPAFFTLGKKLYISYFFILEEREGCLSLVGTSIFYSICDQEMSDKLSNE